MQHQNINKTLNVEFTGFSPNVFPATHVTIDEINYDVFISFYNKNPNDLPDQCISIVLSKQSLITVRDKCSEFYEINLKEILKGFDNFDSFNYQSKNTLYAALPFRINAILINSINDIADISFSYMHPTQTNKDGVISLPVVIGISMTKELFAYFNKILN